MRYGSVCSGIEAASCAWHPLGWRAAFLSEIEAFPRAVLSHHYPSTPLHGDFTTIQAGQYGPIELLVGGTPCQSFSIAGLRGGLADERGNLALEYLRLADRLRPNWLLWENVPGVLSSAGGRDFGSFLGGLGQFGYGFAYRVLDAQFFGLAQRRRRVFVVGYLGDWRRAAAVLFEPASLRRNSPPRRQAGQDVAGTPGARVTAGGGLGTDFECADGLIARPLTANKAGGSGSQRYDWETEALITHTLRADDDHKSRSDWFIADTLTVGANQTFGFSDGITHTLCATGSHASEDRTGRGIPLAVVPLLEVGKRTGVSAERAGIGIGQDGDPMFTLQAGAQHGVAIQQPIAFDLAQITSAVNRTRVGEGLPASTLNAAGQMHVGYRSVVRRLMPMECERLQGFPDGWTDVSYRGKAAADGPRYRALGNSMAVPCMAWIGQRIAAQEADIQAQARTAA